MGEPPPRRRVRDAELLRALAHPLRAAILNYLMAVGPRTASECAHAVDSSPSNCSWHLRQLARFGLVESAEGGKDGRERRWQATQVGLDFGAFDTDPAVRSAQLGVIGAQVGEEQALTQRFLDSADTLDRAWQDAAAINGYSLRITPGELRELVREVDRLVRPYVASVRADPPTGAMPVHVGLRAFRRIEADGEPST